MTREFVDQARRAENPYGSGGAAERIVRILKQTDFSDRFFNKELTF